MARPADPKEIEDRLVSALQRLDRLKPAEAQLRRPRAGAHLYRLPVMMGENVCETCKRPISHGAGKLCRACYRNRAKERYEKEKAQFDVAHATIRDCLGGGA